MTDNEYFNFKCPDCGQMMSVAAAREGKRVACVACGMPATAQKTAETGFSEHPMDAGLPRYSSDYGTSDPYRVTKREREEWERLKNQPVPPQEGDGSSAAGYVAFFLIFVVGNIILFATTGWVLIPR
jgi:hypothetical protein